MIIDFTKFEQGLSKEELNSIKQDCLQASNKCPQSLETQYSPKCLNMKILDYWCNNELLFNKGYKEYLKQSTLDTLIKYKAYKMILSIGNPRFGNLI